jgi:hypothetical protein
MTDMAADRIASQVLFQPNKHSMAAKTGLFHHGVGNSADYEVLEGGCVGGNIGH